MEHVIKILEEELKLLNTPSEEEEDLINAVLSFRKTSEIRLALQILNEFKFNCKTFNLL